MASDKASKESLQVQIKILEEENADLRDVMSQMRRRAYDDRRSVFEFLSFAFLSDLSRSFFLFISFREDRDRNDEIQQLIARAESNARQYLSNFNLTTSSPTSTLVRIIPVSSPTRFS